MHTPLLVMNISMQGLLVKDEWVLSNQSSVDNLGLMTCVNIILEFRF